MPDRSLVANAADAGQVREAQKKEKLREERHVADLAALLQLPEFKRFAWRLLSDLRVFSNAFTADPYDHAFNAGEKNAGLKLIAEMESASPTAFLQMLQDAKTEEWKHG